MSERLTKAERILKRVDFLRVQKSGRKIHSQSFVCIAELPRGEGPPSSLVRLGTTVSRRVGCAVVRNRVKRLLREAFRRHKSIFPSGLELLIIAREQAATIGYVEVERELREIGRRLTCASRPSRLI